MKTAALLVVLLAGSAARADEFAATAHAVPSYPAAAPVLYNSAGVDVALDVFVGMFELATEVALLDQMLEHAPGAPVEDGWGGGAAQSAPAVAGDEGSPRSWTESRRRNRHDARQGLLFAFGFGGGAQHSTTEAASMGAVDIGLRIGYGFSDRFQIFADFSLDTAQYNRNLQLTSWTATLRGQTVLIGDRDGNGLSINAGAGVGGLEYSSYTCDYRDYTCYSSVSSPVGLALAGGLSYDARVGQSFTLSPELFARWHSVPNGAGHPNDHATAFGLRLNFLWYVN
jgi:hypothetical protein